jgi:predicted solute-binding protein
MRLAISNTPINKLFIQNVEFNTEVEHKLYTVSETEALDLLLNERVEAALISPLSYFQGGKINDLRIIPSKCISSIGYTELFSIYFKSGLTSISDCGKPKLDEYFSNLFKILYAENYDLKLNLVTSDKSILEQIGEFHCAVDFGRDKSIELVMDLSDDWFITYNSPLPIAYWVCKNKDNDHDQLALDNLIKLKLEEIKVRDMRNLLDEREGIIKFTWDHEQEKSLEHLLDLLFYHQIIPDMADIKLINEQLGSEE